MYALRAQRLHWQYFAWHGQMRVWFVQRSCTLRLLVALRASRDSSAPHAHNTAGARRESGALSPAPGWLAARAHGIRIAGPRAARAAEAHRRSDAPQHLGVAQTSTVAGTPHGDSDWRSLLLDLDGRKGSFFLTNGVISVKLRLSPTLICSVVWPPGRRPVLLHFHPYIRFPVGHSSA